MKNSLIYYQILPTYSLRKSMEISLENLHVDIGAWRVKGEILISRNPPKVVFFFNA